MSQGQGQSYRAFFDNQAVGMVEVNADGKYLQVNRRWCEMSGYSEDEMLKSDFTVLTYSEDLPMEIALDRELINGKRNSYRMEKRYIHKSGELFWADLSVSGLYDEEGALTGMIGLIVDIGERKKAEQSLTESEAKFRSLLDRLEQIPVQGYDAERRVVYWNNASTAAYGYLPEEALGRKLEDLIIPQGMRKDVIRAVEDSMARGIQIPSAELMLCGKGGRDVPVYSSHLLHTSASGVREMYCVDIDLRRLRETEEQRRLLSQAVEQTGEMIIITDPEGTIEYVNDAFTHVTGFSRAEVLGRKPSILKSGEQNEGFYYDLWKTISEGNVWSGRMINRSKNDGLFIEESSISPVFNGSGQIIHYVATKRDITEQLRTEEEYRQAQKMEAVGQLAGGIAHDFNNMLSIILGQSELALKKLLPGNPLYKRIVEIKNAATRSASLTQQLLGFARKQPGHPRIVNLGLEVTSMVQMLRQLIGENIELDWNPAGGNYGAFIDSGHLSQILTNLIVNARDAISGFGTIRIVVDSGVPEENSIREHASFCPGTYVQLSVSDDGHGMSRETLARVFDPFFSTKDVDKGTGLGLSMVLGLVQQNDGFISVDSSPSEGTTFHLYFPEVSLDDLQPGPLDVDVSLMGMETILIVEDEASVLALLETMLAENGYKVLTARGPFEAQELVENYEEAIDLLLTDIVMPKMSGVELCAALTRVQPGIRTLFMSGYPKENFQQQVEQCQSARLLNKPFSSCQLTKAIRATLDSE